MANPDSATPPGRPGADERARHARELETLHGALSSAVAESQAAGRLLRAHQRELEQTRSALTSGLRTLRRQLELVSTSRAWRYGHGLTKAMSRARGRRTVTEGGVVAALGQVDRLLALLGEPAPRSDDEAAATAGEERATGPDRLPGSRGDELLLGIRVRELLGEMPSETHWPRVSVVIVSCSAALTEAALGHLAEVAYDDLQAIVVDNASPGGEAAQAARLQSRRAVAVESVEAATSFARACNLGAGRATGELLLFLNDDVRAIEPGWLRELVAGAGPGGADVVGATLVDPHPTAARRPGAGGYVLEQRGIALALRGGSLHPVRREEGADVLDGAFGSDIPAVGVSGACLLVARPAFTALGGFDEGYQFGLEDVDLCLRARDRGLRVACSGRAVVIHEGAASRRQAGREFRRINREVNRRRFHRLWAPALYRARLEGLLTGDPQWGPGPRLAIVRTSNDPAGGWGDYHTARELGEAAAALGWQVTYVGQRDPDGEPLPDDLDLAVVLLDRFDARVLAPSTLAFAWVRNWTERWLEQPWLERYDGLLASSERSRTLLAQHTGRPVELFPPATNPRRFHPPAHGGAAELDWVFTGNRWGAERAIESALVAHRRDHAAVYGRGWDEVKRLRALTRGAVDYERLPEVYGSAKVVLDDTAEPTLRYDAVNARVFDALACGTPVITNCAGGVAELFDDEFPTWSSADDLQAALRGLLAEPERRAAIAARYRRTVLAAHTYEHRARGLRRLARAQAAQLSFCLKVGAPDLAQAERWGDLHFARALGRALRRLGHRWGVEVLPDWESLEGSTFDVTIHLRGRSDYPPAPGQFNILWLISHPDSFEPESAAAYDLVCVASSPHAQRLRESAGIPVRVLEQATDPRMFFPDRDPGVAHDLAFVGNARGTRRKILDDLLPTGRDLAVWGLGWEGTPAERHRVADHIANERLRTVYSSAQIVLCDHWPDMRAAGFRSNRLYDALACGALVVSDAVAGLDGSLGEAVVTYEDAADLRAIIDRLLSDPAERGRRVAGARERILAGETFDDRARELVAWVSATEGAAA